MTGVFATRAEYRPNPIAMTTCKILKVDEVKGIVTVADIDAYNGTPIIDLFLNGFQIGQNGCRKRE